VTNGLRLLVCDAYDALGRTALRGVGASEAGALFARVLRRLAPDAAIDVVHPADADAELPAGAALADYDGVVWTGSSLTIHREGDPRVRRQLELARAVLEAGIPSFGSCWGAQLAAVAAGGAAAPNPRGREFGIARRITLSPEGRAHPLYAGKPPVFDALASHEDEVRKLPPGALHLASNAFSEVQAVAVERGRGSFWAVQYHPEYDFHELARLCVLRAEGLVAQGSFRDRAEAIDYAEQLETLHRDPGREDVARRLGVGADVLDPEIRQRELRNWLERRVRPER
jgi:GMP synthase (glutamine-hydrolysing)